jgi:hypothetical protein
MATKMTREEAEKALALLVPALAAELGYKVKKAPHAENMHYAQLESPEGYEIGLWAGYEGGYGSVRVTAYLPKYPGTNDTPWLGTGVTDPKIRFSVSRPARRLADDIRRRLLPEYIPLRTKALELIAQRVAHETVTSSAVETLAKVVSLPASFIRGGNSFTFYNSTGPLSETHGEVKVSGNSVDLKLDVSVEEARVLLTALVHLRLCKTEGNLRGQVVGSFNFEKTS